MRFAFFSSRVFLPAALEDEGAAICLSDRCERVSQEARAGKRMHLDILVLLELVLLLDVAASAVDFAFAVVNGNLNLFTFLAKKVRSVRERWSLYTRRADLAGDNVRRHGVAEHVLLHRRSHVEA
jgi:hypothetical protein